MPESVTRRSSLEAVTVSSYAGRGSGVANASAVVDPASGGGTVHRDPVGVTLGKTQLRLTVEGTQLQHDRCRGEADDDEADAVQLVEIGSIAPGTPPRVLREILHEEAR